MVSDGRRVSGLRLREEMGLQCAGERYAGARSGWVEGSGLCWRAFKCGESGRGRRGGTLTILLASEGAGSGHGVLAVHGGAGRGGRREHLSLRHVLGRTSEDPPLGKMGARPGLDSHRVNNRYILHV